MTVDKNKLEGSTFYLDCQSLVNELSKVPDSDNFPEDPFINTIRMMFLELRITVKWVRSHAEKRKRRQKWSLDDKANWAADQLTHGDLQSVHQVFPELMGKPSNKLVRIVVGSSLIQGQTVTNIYTSQIQYEIQRRHHFLVMGCNNFPISFSKQLKSWRQHNQKEYLTHRQNISTRNIPWTELTIEFSQRTLRKLSISSTQITKLIYDKYWNKQYCGPDHSCPLCMQ